MALWTPAEITTALWLDAADSNTVTLNGSNVSQWDDKSGAGNHFTIPAGWSGPTVDGLALNGQDVLDFPFSPATRLQGLKPDNSMTVFVVLSRASSAGQSIVFGDSSWDTSNYCIAAENSGGGPYGNVTTPVSFVNGALVASPNRATFYNALDGKAALLTVSGGFSTWGANFVLGGYYAVTNSWNLKARVAEVVVIASNAMSDADRQRIEGYLAWKWGLEANLPALHPYELAAPETEPAPAPVNLLTSLITETTARFNWEPWVPPLWTPADITTALWLDAADSSTITLNGSNVSQWDDKSGNVDHAAQAGSTAQPEYLASGLNGMGVVSFDGTNDVMTGDNSAALDDYIALVYRANTHGSNERIFVMRGATTDATSFALRVNSGEATVARTNDPNGRGTDRTFPINTWNLACVRHPNSGNGSETLLLNGATPSSTGTDSNLIAGNIQANKYSIGGRWDAAFSDVDIAEIVVFSDSAQIQKIEGYLAWKWGLEANLPTGHPYEDAPPTV